MRLCSMEQCSARHERQGLLVEEKALEDAEKSCLADAGARAAAPNAVRNELLLGTRSISTVLPRPCILSRGAVRPLR
jgi:hypothetical protein